MYSLSDYNYHLPQESIAQEPAGARDGARLLRLERETGILSHHCFRDLETLLRPGDLLVINNTKVIPARLRGAKETGGKVEVFILDYVEGLEHLRTHGFFQCSCLIRASKSPRPGTRLTLAGELRAQVVAADSGTFVVRFSGGSNVADHLKSAGEIPLPPYIRRNSTGRASDLEDYQTVYAREEGAVAAPTAGLHFTPDLLGRLEKKGVEVAVLTLHVGYGTFVPVRVDDIREHDIHSEYYVLPDDTVRKINAAKQEGRRVVAVGTTSVRTLEFAADDQGRLVSGKGMCNLFIYPGYRFRVVDAMITNFHLPESTLLMLVSAFAGRESVLNAYETAIREKYRFYSYGDAMLIEQGDACLHSR